jgi:peptide chain release factor 2
MTLSRLSHSLLLIMLSLGAIVGRRVCVCALTSTSTSGYKTTTAKRRTISSAWTNVNTGTDTRRHDRSSRVLMFSTTNTAMDETFGESKRKFAQAEELYQRNLASTPFNVHEILKDFETEASDPSFWDADQKERNSYVTSQISYYTRLVNRLNAWKQHYGDCQAALEMMQSEDLFTITDMERDSLLQELQQASQALLEDSEQYQLELLLSGPYDKQPCRLILTAGAGGTEANDWVADLKRMYERHALKLGYSVVVEDEQAGEVVGFKSVELHISGGPHAYGWFKGEKGAHRLVRLSPFNANNKRQTTFAGVDVAPILMEQDLQEIVIPDKDLEITTMRSGGAGGQNVNKVNSAVRIKHLPSGLNVKCTQERSQAMNKDIAMKRLKGQLLAIAKEQRVQEIKEIRGDQVEASWGAQIRNYVLHPYKMIKDQRTNWETANTQSFLDGDLEECIAGLLRRRAEEELEADRQETGAF